MLKVMRLGLTPLMFLPLQGLLGAPEPDPEPGLGYLRTVHGDYDQGNLPVHGSKCVGGPCEDNKQQSALENHQEQGNSVLQQELK